LAGKALAENVVPINRNFTIISSAVLPGGLALHFEDAHFCIIFVFFVNRIHNNSQLHPILLQTIMNPPAPEGAIECQTVRARHGY
jgi:hypothetical protein